MRMSASGNELIKLKIMFEYDKTPVTGVIFEAQAFIKDNQHRLPGDSLSEDDFYAELRRIRNRYLKDLFSYALEHKDRIFSDGSLYLVKIPTSHCGSSISGKMVFPLGALLESWENCPDFRLDDGSRIISFGGHISGAFIGESIHLDSGEVTEHMGLTLQGKPVSWQHFADLTRPYRAKAIRLLKAGIIPRSADELLPRPEEVKSFPEDTRCRKIKRLKDS